MARLLFERCTTSYDLNLLDANGYTLLMRAAIHGEEELTELLCLNPSVSSLVKDDTEDGSGFTALHYAACDGRLNICRILLDVGKADINALTNNNWTPLHFAAYQNREAVVRLLLEKERGADLNLLNTGGDHANQRTALDLTTSDVIQELMKAAGCEVAPAPEPEENDPDSLDPS